MSSPAEDASSPAPAEEKSGRGAALVAAGIFASRVFGLVRERVFAHYLGNSVAAAAFKAGLRIPNLLQNLFGEGVLSASFIPVYAGLIGEGKKEEADRVASAVFAILALVVSLLGSLGVFGAPYIVDLVAPGFEGEGRALAIDIVRLLFPATSMLVLSAWCLGVLNSHRRFFLSYVAPVIWNVAIIVALVARRGQAELATIAYDAAIGTLIGSALQFLVQMPVVLSLLGSFRPRLSVVEAGVRQVLKSFVPVVIGRGVVNVSAFIDTAYASLISPRALSALSYGQTLYLLPVSLFGMAVSAAELPAMSQLAGSQDQIAERLRARIDQGLSRIGFFVVPSAAALVFLGDLVGAALFQTGRFGAADSRYLWLIMAGAGIGLMATTAARLYASAFYAQKDPRTPLRVAIVRVLLGATLGYAASLHAPRWLGLPSDLGAAGITLTSSVASWVELNYLRIMLRRRIGKTGLGRAHLGRLLLAAGVAAGAALSVKYALTRFYGVEQSALSDWGGSFLAPPQLHPILAAAIVLGVFGLIYLAITLAFGLPEARGIGRRLGLKAR